MKSDGSSRQRFALRRRIDRVLSDRESGAAEIAAAATRVLDQAEALGYTPARLERLKNQLLKSHPAMGSVWQAVHTDEPRKFAADLRNSSRETIRLARRFLRRSGPALTLSYSSSVIAAIGRRGSKVLVAESLPGGEGARTAKALRRLGAQSEVVADAAIAVAASRAAYGVIGADAVTPYLVVNKVGSYLLALACQATQIPLYVIADSSKLVPEDWPVPEFGPRQPFEAVPRVLVTKIICDAL